VQKAGVDFLTCGTYKWLLGPLGLSFFYVRADLLAQLQSPFAGEMQASKWSDPLQKFTQDAFPAQLYETARKFEYATIHFQGLYELRAALEYIQGIGMDRIEEQVLKLASRLWSGLEQLGFELLTPRGTESGIVTCAVRDEQEVAGLLEENRIVASLKPGGQLRFSPSFFNTEAEIDHTLSVVERLT